MEKIKYIFLKINKSSFLKRLTIVFVVLIGLYLIVINAINKYVNYANPNSIIVNGFGEIASVPDISTINFTIRVSSSKDDTKYLQDQISIIENGIFSKLADLGIDKKDIQTLNYAVNPKFIYLNGKSSIDEYEASENINVKIRNTENIAKILSILSDMKITEISGPNFEVDNMEKLKGEARDLAILDAKNKAEVLAKSLGVKIENILSYTDDSANESPFPNPILYSAKSEAQDSMAYSLNSPNLEEGEQKITSNVSITFRIEN